MTPTSPDRPKLTRAEAARLNGARSRGPRTAAGKARSALNALKHGLTAERFALLPGEDAAAYQELLDRLTARYRPADELAAHLVQRLASCMWRQQRADRLEAEVLTRLEQRHDSSYVGGYVPNSPHTWDVARFSAVQRQQARLDRLLFKLTGELDRLTPADGEGDSAANDNAAATGLPNEPNEEPAAATAAAPTAPPPAPAPLDFDDPVLPLTPELRDLLERGGEENWKLFCRGRRAQIDAALRAAGLPGLPPRAARGQAGAAAPSLNGASSS